MARLKTSIFIAAAALITVGTAAAQTLPAWSPEAAAGYLDGRASWWMDWPKAQRDHGTFCVSCHTLAPFALGRPSLRGALHETSQSPNEKRMLENITRRVRMWKEVEPFYADQTSGLPKTSESRGTEAIFNALILASNDAPSGKLGADAKLALDNMWALQLKTGDMNGAWAWLQFHNAPWEGDSQFYGNTLAALAISIAPGGYAGEPGIQGGLKSLRAWLQKNMGTQTPADRVVLLWASAKLSGLLSREQQEQIVAETLAKQKDDGGFSMSTLGGGWKRRDNTPIDPASDGYATGIVALALENASVPAAAPALARALGWLARNQQQSDGRWAATSMNKQRELSSDAGLFMSDAATAYAVMALANAAPRK